jgi:hypothetical protein
MKKLRVSELIKVLEGRSECSLGHRGAREEVAEALMSFLEDEEYVERDDTPPPLLFSDLDDGEVFCLPQIAGSGFNSTWLAAPRVKVGIGSARMLQPVAVNGDRLRGSNPVGQLTVMSPAQEVILLEVVATRKVEKGFQF